MCNCGGRASRAVAARTAQTWKVTFPNGTSVTKNSEAAAQIAAGKVDGATYAKVT